MSRVKELLKEKDMLLKDLSEKMGVSRQSLSKQIKGMMLVETAGKIADALDVPLWRLFATDEEVLQDIRSRNAVEEYCPHCGERIET